MCYMGHAFLRTPHNHSHVNDTTHDQPQQRPLSYVPKVAVVVKFDCKIAKRRKLWPGYVTTRQICIAI